MAMHDDALARAGGHCELCAASADLSAQLVSPKTGTLADDYAVVCPQCIDQLVAATQVNADTLDQNHLRCLNDAMWSPVPAVQVIAYRLLGELQNQGAAWAGELIDMMYLDDEMQQWANYRDAALDVEPTLDANGSALQAGDNVVLVKDLPVKGANFTAKRGTAVRGIGLTDNPKHIQGKINGQQIVIIAAYVKK